MRTTGVILLISVLVVLSQARNFSLFPNSRSSWIEGGSNAATGEFPYMVIIARFEARSVGYSGGSIVNNWYILTAAHSLVGASASKIKITVGTIKFNSGVQTYNASRIIIHHGHDPITKKHDIALLKISEPIVYSPTVKPVILPRDDESTTPGKPCVFTGWGLTSRTATSSASNLQKLRFIIISRNRCRKRYTCVYETDICAVAGPGKGTCRGDSGAPLICGNKQVGVHRGGGRKGSICSSPAPDVFVYVPNYISWIRQHTG